MDWSFIILVGVCAITYAVEIVFGLGGTVLMIPVLRWWFPEKTLVVFSVLPQILVAVIGLAASPWVINLRFLLRVLLFATAGAVLGLVVFHQMNSALYAQCLALVLIATGLYLFYRPAHVRAGAGTGHVLDTSAGFAQGLFGISGPISMTRFLGTFDNKTVVRNYGFAFFLTLNLVRAAGYTISGQFDQQIATMMLVATPVLGIVLWFANRWHFRLSEQGFRRMAAGLIVIGGLSLFFRTGP